MRLKVLRSCIWDCHFFREVVLFLRAVNDDVDNNLKVVFCMCLTDVIKGCFLIPILGEKPVGPIRHKWGRCSSLPTVLCESSFSQLYSCGIINHYDWLLIIEYDKFCTIDDDNHDWKRNAGHNGRTERMRLEESRREERGRGGWNRAIKWWQKRK